MLFEDEINHTIANINLFEVVYKKNKFVLDGKEYPIGYTSYLAIQPECRLMDETLFYDLFNFSVKLVDEFTKDNLDVYYQSILKIFNSLKSNPFFSIINLEKYIERLSFLFSEERKEQYFGIYEMYQKNIEIDTREKADRIDKFLKIYDDFITVLAIGRILFKSVKELKHYAALAFQITHRIVEHGARTKSQLADAFGDFLSNSVMQFLFHTDQEPFRTHASIIPVIENLDGKNFIFRKVYFNNLKDFLNTDLFEGYVQGHYLWRCDICDNYFFMTTAHKQLYCSNVNPQYGVPCSYVAKHPEIVKRKMERQKKTVSPYYLIWKRRNDLIRKNKSLGKYSEVVSAKAKEYIDECFEMARMNFDYAEHQYEQDMEMENIYREAKKRLDVSA